MTRCRSTLMVCILGGVFGLSARSEAQTPTVSDLPRANRCSTRAPLVYSGGPTTQTTMRVSSGGGWCWFDLWATKGSFRYVATFTVTRAPVHGEILMGEVNQNTRIAYKPVSGFIGHDSFVIVDKITNSERPVVITVVQ
jgi:hypothetical protein